MRRAITIIALIAALTGVVCALGPAVRALAADSPDPSAAPLTIEVTDLPLKNVLQLLMRESGVNIIMGSGQEMDRPITASIRNQPLDLILKQVLAGSGVRYVRTEEGTYIIGQDVDAERLAPAPTTADVRSPAPEPVIATPAPLRRTRTEKIPLRYLNGKQAMIAIGAISDDNALDPSSRARPWTGGSLDVFRGMLSKVDIIQVENPAGSMVPVQGANPNPTVNVNIPSAPTTDTPGSAVANRTADPNLTPNQYTRPTQSRGNIDPQQGSTRSSTQGTTSTGEGSELLPDGIDSLRALDSENALLVKGEDDAIQELKDLITLVDVPPLQVMIKAEFVEVNTTITRRLGIDWLLSRPDYILQTNFLPSGNVVAYVQSGNLTTNLRAELTNSGGKIVNAPIISTLNNTAATISIGRQIPFYQSVTQITGQGIPVTSSAVSYVDASTELSVLPQINGDRSITLIMQPRVSDSSGTVTGPDNTSAPIISQSVLSTARRVGNGETIVVGGFIKKNDNNGTSRIPILADLPIIGKLFQSSNVTKSDTETLIFVTPTVIEDVSSGPAVGVIGPPSE